MKWTDALVLFVLVCAAPMAARADCGGDCVTTCAPKGSGSEYADCMKACLDDCLVNDPPAAPPVPQPTPVEPPG
jgi:hypothetical protein